MIRQSRPHNLGCERISKGAHATRRDSVDVNALQCLSKYTIALLSPEFGSVFFCVN
jgi:hypothetical protein